MKCCTFEGCNGPVKAKGLCATHYMRLRRTGDPAKVRSAGRPASLAALRMLFRDYSDRTFARYRLAMECLTETEGDTGFLAAVQRCERSNGTINVSALEREAGQAAARYVEAQRATNAEAR